MSDNLPLIPRAQWIEPTLTVADNGQTITFSIQDAFNYHGYDAVGGVVLGFRLLQSALERLAKPGELPERRQISLFTAFPGLGARDCFELVTRMATENRIVTNTDFQHGEAQKGIFGRFYFRFSYQGREIALAPIAGYPSEEFLAFGRASKQADATPEIQRQWQNAKNALANTLLSAHYRDVIRIL